MAKDNESGETSVRHSRRGFFRQVGFAGAAIAVSATPLGCTPGTDDNGGNGAEARGA